jgi:hypothetical protein
MSSIWSRDCRKWLLLQELGQLVACLVVMMNCVFSVLYLHGLIEEAPCICLTESLKDVLHKTQINPKLLGILLTEVVHKELHGSLRLCP